MKNKIIKKIFGIVMSVMMSLISVANEKVYAMDPYEAKLMRRDDFRRKKEFLRKEKAEKRFLRERKFSSKKDYLRDYDFSSRDYRIMETEKKEKKDRRELKIATKILSDDVPKVDVSDIEVRGFTRETVGYLFDGLKKEDFQDIRFKIIVGKGIGSPKGPVLKNFVIGLCKSLGVKVSAVEGNSGALMIGSGKKSEVPAVIRDKYFRMKVLNGKSKKELQEVAKTHEGLEAMIVYANNLIDTGKERAGIAILEVVMLELDRSKTSEYYDADKAIGFARKFL